MERPAWIKEQKNAEDFEIIRNSNWNGYKDFVMDGGCYLLIKVYQDNHEIGVAICSHQHIRLKEFRGRIAQEIYHALLEYDQKNNKGWITRFEHAAYLGKELKKAEIAMALNLEYIQE